MSKFQQLHLRDKRDLPCGLYQKEAGFDGVERIRLPGEHDVGAGEAAHVVLEGFDMELTIFTSTGIRGGSADTSLTDEQKGHLRRALLRQFRREHGPRLPPDPDGLNDERAMWARAVLPAFQRQTGQTSPVEDEDALIDLGCNLLHLADRTGLGSAAMLRRVQEQYEDETAP